MKRITWTIKDNWVETKKAHPSNYTDYVFCRGWVRVAKLFPDVKSIYAIGGHGAGSHIYWHNFRPCNFGRTLNPFKTFFFRVDLGRWFVIVTRPVPDCYRNVDIVSIK